MSSCKCIIGTPSGIELTRNVQRQHEESRWLDDIGKILVGVPWCTSKDDPEQDGIIPMAPSFPPVVDQQPISETVVPRKM